MKGEELKYGVWSKDHLPFFSHIPTLHLKTYLFQGTIRNVEMKHIKCREMLRL